jgi:hypothetical protein
MMTIDSKVNENASRPKNQQSTINNNHCCFFFFFFLPVVPCWQNIGRTTPSRGGEQGKAPYQRETHQTYQTKTWALRPHGCFWE